MISVKQLKSSRYNVRDMSIANRFNLSAEATYFRADFLT